MPGRNELPADLIEQARRGEFTRRTAITPEERSAAYRVEHERQLARRRPGETIRQALGHPASSSTLPLISAFLDDPPRFAVLDNVTRRDAARVGKYENLVRQLRDGKITGDAFRRRVSRWRTVAGHRLLADPEAVLVLLDTLRAEDRELFVYESGRAS